MADADGGLARIAADDHELHAFAEIVGKCSHYASLLCPLILLLSREVRSAHFDIGGQASLGILAGKKKLPEIALDAIRKSSSSCRKRVERRTEV
jgi:hypothetical protein